MKCIYKLTSPSNKIYIGQTINFKNRMGKYKNVNCKNQTKIYNAIKKYGFDSFKVEVLIEVESKEYLDKLEKFFIKFYNSFENGYKCNTGGKFYKISEEQKKRLSKVNKETTKQRLNIRVASTDIDGNILKEFDSLKDASIFYNTSSSNISRSAKGQYKKLKDLNFIYLGKPKRKYKQENPSGKGCGIKKTVFTNKNGKICEYNSLLECSEKIGISLRQLNRVLKNGKKYKDITFYYSVKK